MNPFWSQIARELSPYVPGEQPRIADLVKLNTNESPFGPSPLALEAMRAAAVDTLRLYPDPEATELRAALAAHHGVKPEQVFASNGSDEVLEHAVLVRHFNKPRTALRARPRVPSQRIRSFCAGGHHRLAPQSTVMLGSNRSSRFGNPPHASLWLADLPRRQLLRDVGRGDGRRFCAARVTSRMNFARC
jgi:hypothetical protein